MLTEAGRHASANDVAATWIEARAEDLSRRSSSQDGAARYVRTVDPLDRWRPGAVFGPRDRGTRWCNCFDRTGARAPDLHLTIRRPADSPRTDRGAAQSLPRLVTEPASRHLRNPAPTLSFRRVQRELRPGRTDIVRTTDEVVSNYLSMSFAAPDRFGEDLDAFVADVTAVLTEESPSGLFHDWPGDTAVVWASKRIPEQ